MYLSKLIKCYTSNMVITMQCLEWGGGKVFQAVCVSVSMCVT